MNSELGSTRERVEAYMNRLGLALPILLAPMSGACPPALSAAVANAGGMGGCGALLLSPEAIADWVREFRRQSQGLFQLNLWIPDPAPVRHEAVESRQREFLAAWGPAVSAEMGSGLPDFRAQCQATLDAQPAVISSIMGLYPPDFVSEMKARGILWFAVATTVAEARAAADAGADAIVAQGMEAGGHRGAFAADAAEQQLIGLIALLPQVVDAVSVPVIATGGIADARGVAAALVLGASAVQIGTGFLRAAESNLHPAYVQALGNIDAEKTAVTRAYSGRAGRCIDNPYVRAAAAPGAPRPSPYPVQRGLTRAMREEALRVGDTEKMQMWAGQAARLARTQPAGVIARELWAEASQLLR